MVYTTSLLQYQARFGANAGVALALQVRADASVVRRVRGRLRSPDGVVLGQPPLQRDGRRRRRRRAVAAPALLPRLLPARPLLDTLRTRPRQPTVPPTSVRAAAAAAPGFLVTFCQACGYLRSFHQTALPVNGSTHLIPAYYSFIDPERMNAIQNTMG